MTGTRIQQMIGIVLLAAGWGWAGSNFTPGDVPWWNVALHAIPVLILLLLSLGFFSAENARQRGEAHSNWASIGLSIVAAISLIGFVAGIIMGVTNPAGAYGISTPGDWVAAVMLILGGLGWLTALIPARRGSVMSRSASKS